MNVFGITIPDDALSDRETEYLKVHAAEAPNVNEIWQLMDKAWDECGAGYKESDEAAVSRFYDSPVWLLNGLFTEVDPVSMDHRLAIAHWVREKKPHTVAEFGGGFGSLARKIAEYCPDSDIQIVEPHPSRVAKRFAKKFDNIHFADTLPQSVDLAIAQDVLEHVADPLSIFYDLLSSVRPGGLVVTANCFFPVIKCHLPSTFHFRNTFRFIAPNLGCEYVGVIPGAIHAQVFRKSNFAAPNWKKARRAEHLSRAMYPFTEPGMYFVRPLARMILRRLTK